MGSLVNLTAPAGIVSDITDYQAQLRYTDADLVRFRAGAPEKIGGWVYRDGLLVQYNYVTDEDTTTTINTVPGICRKIFQHKDLQGNKYLFYFTTTHVYTELGGFRYDITPFRTDPVTLTDKLTTGAAGSATVIITDSGNSIAQTDPQSRILITSLSGTDNEVVVLDGITLTVGEYLCKYLSSSTYSLTPVSGTGASISGTAGSGAITGGGAMTLRYIVSNGSEDGAISFGWGSGLWGQSTWGTPRTAGIAGTQVSPRVWSVDAWGEDIICAPAEGTDTAYYIDTSEFENAKSTYRGTTLKYYIDNTLSGDGSQVPVLCGKVMVSTPDRHIVFFGANTFGTTAYDPLLVRFSNQEDLATWTPAIENSAGDQRLGTGTKIQTASKGRGQLLIHTDVDVYSMQFVGPPFTFAFQQVSDTAGSISENCVSMVEGAAYWMTQNNFYVYDGSVQSLECSVHETVFDNLSKQQIEKVTSGTNTKFNEIWWFYPSSSSSTIDKYVIYNYIDRTWSIGSSLQRTAWNDYNIFAVPLAADTDGYIYEQESGYNNVNAAMTAFIETGFFNGDETGNNMYFMDKIIPDTKFESGTDIKFQLKSKRYPNGTETTKGPFTLTSSTNKLNLRARGRSFQTKYFSDTVDTQWRLGTWRAQAQADGTR
jgi:hypothetical protein